MHGPDYRNVLITNDTKTNLMNRTSNAKIISGREGVLTYLGG